MANALMMKLQLQLAEKVSGPLQRMQAASLGNAKALEQTRAKLLQLEQQQGLIQRIRQQETAWKSASNQLRINRANLDSLRNSGTATEAQLRRQSQLVDRSTTAFNKQRSTLVQLRTQASNAGIGNLTQAEAKLGTQIANTTRQLEQQNNALQRMDALKSQRDESLGNAAKIGGTGMAMRMMGQRGLNAAASFMMPGFEFDQTMARVQALTQLEKDSELFQALRQQARDLGASTNFSAVDAAEGQAYLAMAGFKPDAIMAAMPGLLDMSLASNVDLGKTADISSNILSGFGLDPSEMGRVGDVLTTAFTSSNTTLEELGYTMAYMAPQARAAGVSLEEAAAMAGLLANIGIKGSSSGTMLRNMLGKLSDTGSKALRGLGIRTADANGNLRELPELLLEINKATAHMGSAKRLTILKEIFDIRGVAGANELLEQVANGGLQELTNKLENSQGAAKRTAAIVNEHLGGKLQELESGWEEFGNQFYDSISEPLSDIVIMVTEVIGKFNEWAKANPELVATIAKVTGVVLSLMVVIGSIMVVIGGILAPLAIFKFTLGVIGIKGLGLVNVIKNLGGVFMWLGRLAMAHPIIALLAVIAFAAYKIYENWDSFVWFFNELWEGVTSIFNDAVAGITQITDDLWASVNTFFNSGIGNITATLIDWSPIGLFHKAFAEVLSWFGIDLPETFTGFGGMLMDGLINGITNMAGAVRDSIVGIGDSVVGWFREKLNMHSPSRVFMAAGADISRGAALGIENTIPRVERAADTLASATLAPIQSPAGASSQQRNNASPVLHIAGDTISININAEGLNAQTIAEAVRAEFEKHERKKAARLRSAFST